MGLNSCTFPFGQRLYRVEQADRTPKPVFVLGVYASAVHARWVREGRVLIRALAVASEPHIFWRGDGAAEVIGSIRVPDGAGTLDVPDAQFNGPSGVALDESILRPLRFRREDAWLCDLVPHSCVNDAQRRAIEREYLPLASRYGMPFPSIPPVPKVLADEARRLEILDEFAQSPAETLVLLGDQPIRWFLRHFDRRWQRLSDLLPYGSPRVVRIADRTVSVIALAHPRQVARLGLSSSPWYESHQVWATRRRERAGS